MDREQFIEIDDFIAELESSDPHLKTLMATAREELKAEIALSKASGENWFFNHIIEISTGQLTHDKRGKPFTFEQLAVRVLRAHRFCGDAYPSNGWFEVNYALALYMFEKRNFKDYRRAMKAFYKRKAEV